MLVTFSFLDSRSRRTTRSFWNTEATLALVLAAVTALVAEWNPLTDLALEKVTITNVSTADAFAGAAVSNIDENVSVQVIAANGRRYDIDLPDVPDAKTPGENMDITDADLVAFFALFAGGGTWRVNPDNPQAITTIVKATLDK